jgi:hypothetical protein
MKNKLKIVVKDYKKFKTSDVYRELMKIERKLVSTFSREAPKCKYFTSNGCKHKRHKDRRCHIDLCPRY